MNELKNGRPDSMKRIDNKTAASVTTKDSLMNCIASCFLNAPSDLRTPISLARSADFAVVRLMKLTQAMINVRIAAVARMYT